MAGRFHHMDLVNYLVILRVCRREGWDEMLLLRRSGEHRAAGRQNLGQLQRWSTKNERYQLRV